MSLQVSKLVLCLLLELIVQSQATILQTLNKLAAQIQARSDRTDEQLADVKSQLMSILQKLSWIEKLLNDAGSDKAQRQLPCYRGMRAATVRQKIVLWNSLESLCDTASDCGGWVVIQRRTRGDVDFYMSWSEYRSGFGNITTDFWLGLDVLANLTSQGFNELRIDMTSYQGFDAFAQYANFSVADEQSKYLMTVGGYSGTAFDLMNNNNGAYFSTFDRDNDNGTTNCAQTNRGGWWFAPFCGPVNLNGGWDLSDDTGIHWENWRNITFTEMKVRRV